MGIRNFESIILAEAKEVVDKKLKLREIMEWSTGDRTNVQEGETMYHLPRCNVAIAVKREVK